MHSGGRKARAFLPPVLRAGMGFRSEAIMREKRINRNRIFRGGRRSAGFTLVEIVVVICVIVAFSGVVTVSFGKFDQDSRLNVAAGKALADLRYTQEVAMTERREVNFYVSSSTRYYATYQAGGNVKSPLNPGQSLSVNLNSGDAKGIVITSSAVSGSRLSFNSDGVPLLNGNVLANQLSVMLLNGKQNIVLFPSGYSVINPVSGACGGCGC
jgi:type II secretory pathway pseudopilin PulG